MLCSINTKGLMLFIGLSFIAFIFNGCAEQDDVSADIAEIEKIIKEDTDGIYGISLAAEEDSSDYSAVMTKTADDINTRAFWRRVQLRRAGLNVTKIGEDTAIAQITFRMTGYLVLNARVGNTGTFTRYFKPMKHTFQRKVRFLRNETDSLNYWRRDAITPAYGVSDNGTLSLTNPVVITINRGGEIRTITIADPLNHFIPFGRLPAWGPGDVIKIEVPIANSNAGDLPLGFAHRGRYGNVMSRQRAPFHDDGLNGDAVAGDGIYTAQWTAISTAVVGPHLGIIDLFAHSAVFTDNAPYNSLAIMFPFVKLAD